MTIFVLIGMIFISMGYAIVDPILSIIIAAIILNTGISILLENIKVLMDSNVLDNADVEKCLMSIEDVKGVTNIRSRGTESHVFLDLHIILDSSMSIEKAL